MIITRLIKYIVTIVGNIVEGIINTNYKAIVKVFIEVYFKVTAKRNTMSQYVPTRYKVLCIIDKRCRVRIYVRGEAVYIYTSLRGQVCALS